MKTKGITTFTVLAKVVHTPAQVLVRRENGITVFESHPGHAGRPGEVGGSAPGQGGLGKRKLVPTGKLGKDVSTVLQRNILLQKKSGIVE